MTTVEKCCTKCKRMKVLSEFYVRSGFVADDNPGHYVSECIVCMKLRNYEKGYVHPTMPRTETEILAINYLNSHQIHALPGKAVHAANVDVVAWGCVWIEVKHARYESLNGYSMKRGYRFSVTPKQRERGFLAQIIMLICDHGHEGQSFHLFPSNFPAFYKQGRIKSGFDYVPGRTEPDKRLYEGIDVLTDRDMSESRDRLDLIENVRLRIGLGLAAESQSANS